jgi:hypothetical protein
VAAAGLSDRVDIDLCDYRDVYGRYDAVLSVEMIEAVGYRFWPTYFQTLDRLVMPGGRVAIQAITMPHDRMLATRNTYTWIQKYIFPGGMLPSTEAIMAITERHTRLCTVDMYSLRPHYAQTLRLWRERFVERRDAVAALGFDDVFHRMWWLYLAYSEAGFESDISMYCGPSPRKWPMNFIVVSAASLAILVVHAPHQPYIMAVDRRHIVDVTWGIGFVAVAPSPRHWAPVTRSDDCCADLGRGVGCPAVLAHDRQVRG